MNKIVLIGNLTRDPELKYLANGTAVANYSLAVTNPFRKNDEGKPTADFINIVSFNKQAESLANYMRKGCKVAVEGRLQIRSWEDDNGNKRYATEVIANSIEFLTFPKQETDDALDKDLTPINDEDDLPFN